MVTTIEKLDETGFVHGPRPFGPPIARLEYTFTPVGDGTLYENSITFGPDLPVLRPLFNRVIRPRVFPDAKARAWFKHNVEEVGNFEFFLPELYEKEEGLTGRSTAPPSGSGSSGSATAAPSGS
jgi:hypothetical protein